MSNRSVAEIARDPRILAISTRISGKSLVPFKATLFNKTGKINWLVAWHQDTTLPIETFVDRDGWSAPSRKAGRSFAQAPASVLEKILAIRIHLDAVTESNGPLRVIRGSHRSGILTDDELRAQVSNGEQVDCLVGRGGIVAMRPLLVHASSKIVSDQPRRVIHIEYAESLEFDKGIRLALA